jgi:putative ABC transport system permease protein
LLPILQRKIKWPEFDRTILLAGVRGEVPILQADRKKPLQEPVSSGAIVLGAELHRSLHLQTGDHVRLLGREFIVGKLHSEMGTKDDITAWINLREAQELLEQPGRINGIFALECVCAAESLSKVRAEIVRILPDTQVIEFQSQMLARAEARQRAATEARESLGREREYRARQRKELAHLMSVSVPLVVLGAGAWVGFLSLANGRERRVEIGVFCALGLRSSQLLCILLGRAFLMGIGGAILGAGLGLLISQTRHTPNPPLPGLWLLGTLAGAPLLAILATWLPAFHATQQDPAQVLHDP